jgi:hypothetical protein
MPLSSFFLLFSKIVFDYFSTTNVPCFIGLLLVLDIFEINERRASLSRLAEYLNLSFMSCNCKIKG